MEHPLDAPERAADGAAVEDVAAHALDVGLGEVVELGARAQRQAQIVPAIEQCAGDVRADQAGAPGEQSLPQGGRSVRMGAVRLGVVDLLISATT